MFPSQCTAPINDDFNANTTITFEDLIARNEQEQTDFWVDLEPSGRLHVKIDLRWSQGKPFTSCPRTVTQIVFLFRNQSTTNSNGDASTEQQRSAVPEPSAGRYETSRPPGQRSQVHGDLLAPANILFALPRIHLVSSVARLLAHSIDLGPNTHTI